MKAIFCLFISLNLLSVPFSIMAQDQLKYRRSSLHMVMVESGSYPNKDQVVKAYKSYPFPDKYNKHLVGSEFYQRTMNDADFKQAGYLKDTLKSQFAIVKANAQLKTLKYLDKENKTAVVIPSSMDTMRAKIELTVSKDRLANQLVAKWFNMDAAGNFNTDLIMERGKYSASEEEKEIANKMITSGDYLYDEELIGNTFTVFSKFKFYPNEPVARYIKDGAISKLDEEAKKAGMPDFMYQKAKKAIEDLYERTKEGYTVITTSFLYQLNWDKKTAEAIKQNFVNEKDAMKRKKYMDTTSVLGLKFLGEQTSTSIVTFKFGEKRTEEQVIDLSVKRNLDRVFAMLQREYEVFRPVSPINSTNPVTARIGIKEGIEPGQKFEILESTKDKKTGFVKWKSVGSIKVDDKLPVWDNRYGAEAEGGNKDGQGNPLPAFTTFKGSADVIPGVHVLRLKK